MKKLVFMFVAMAAMTLAMTTTSCKKGGAKDSDSVKDTTAAAAPAPVAADSVAPVAADSVK